MIKLLKHLLVNNTSWWFYPTFLKKNPKIAFQRGEWLKNYDKETIKNYFKKSIVLNGIFKGLKYPSLDSFGSALYPKLIGSYEYEIQDILKQLLSNHNYNTFVDFGCAEGYYLTGIGISKNELKLIGVDVSDTALSLSKKMLEYNNIEPKRYQLTKNLDFALFNENKKFLLIVDCEGYESILIDKIEQKNISKIDFIIECHDFLIPNITAKLVEKLKKTHQIKIIKSTPDEDKITYLPANLYLYTKASKLNLVAEGRPEIMNWIIAESIL